MIIARWELKVKVKVVGQANVIGQFLCIGLHDNKDFVVIVRTDIEFNSGRNCGRSCCITLECRHIATQYKYKL